MGKREADFSYFSPHLSLHSSPKITTSQLSSKNFFTCGISALFFFAPFSAKDESDESSNSKGVKRSGEVGKGRKRSEPGLGGGCHPTFLALVWQWWKFYEVTRGIMNHNICHQFPRWRCRVSQGMDRLSHGNQIKKISEKMLTGVMGVMGWTWICLGPLTRTWIHLYIWRAYVFCVLASKR